MRFPFPLVAFMPLRATLFSQAAQEHSDLCGADSVDQLWSHYRSADINASMSV
jgi:hypothetical protein